MKRLPMLLFVLSLPGCIFYRDKRDDLADDPVVDTDDGPTDRPDRPDDTDGPDDTDVVDTGTDDVPDFDVVLDPDEAAPGEVVILSVTSDGVPDLSEVTDLRFYGDADVVVLALRKDGPGRLLAAVEVPPDADPGLQDVFLELGGSAELYRDAFRVTAP